MVAFPGEVEHSTSSWELKDQGYDMICTSDLITVAFTFIQNIQQTRKEKRCNNVRNSINIVTTLPMLLQLTRGSPQHAGLIMFWYHLAIKTRREAHPSNIGATPLGFHPFKNPHLMVLHDTIHSTHAHQDVHLFFF